MSHEAHGELENAGAAPTSTTPDRAGRRPRPVLVELASALLLVGGAINLLLSVQALVSLSQQGSQIGLLTAASIAVSVATLGLGVLVRTGRAWLVAINVVAVLAFLELISGSLVGLVFGGIDMLVVVALLRERPWFVARDVPATAISP